MAGENRVMFRDIPPGRYEFRVKARIHNQEWDGETAILPIDITPPLWLTGWAKLIYTLTGLTVAFALLWTYKKRMDIQISYELEKKNHEKEQELNNERLRFYTNITHELRTPLTLILGPLEDMQKETSLQPKHQQKLFVVHQSAIRLLNLINQILEFRKTETQNKELCVGKGNIAEVVQETGLKYKELNRKPGISFNIAVERERMPMFFDKEVVTIILDNLVSNAIKYTEKGVIGISLYTTVKGEVSYTEIKVSDTGYGISPEALTKIFDRYYQAKNEHQASGTGIGLALVKNLVALHEGEIRVESHLNEGSSFYVSFLTHHTYPNARHADAGPETRQTKEPEAAIKAKEPSDETKPILLVVEDNADIRDYIADSFKESFEVLKAENGEAGIRLAQAKIPDIIVSDIMMPVMNGITFCKIIKEDVQTSHIPVVLLTAKDSLQDKEEGYEARADSYLTKPFSATLLHSRINNLLESRRKLASRISSTVDFATKSAILNESLNRLDNEFLQRITELIEEKLDSDKVDITYLSDKMCMSSSTLYRKMKALTGSSTNEYVRKTKIRNAERLLLEGKYNVSEIAFKVGINSPVYFRQCFKEEFGVSPTDYLKQLKRK
jgi:signal transduction histidine kinase/DNA-binding response OmpR family regulator